MAYGLKYILPFKNRRQNDIFRAEIWQKDYADSTITVLEGSETPVTVEWTNQDINLQEPINPLQITLSFLNQGLTIEYFYSDDDEAFRVDFYFQSFSDGTGTEKLLYTTYLVQDGVQEAVTDQTHVIVLKSTDNIALLKNVKWNETSNSYNDTIALGGYIREALQSTGLYSHDTTIDMSLPLRIYDNLFENTEDDRGDDPLNDPMSQTTLYPNAFQNNDGAWFDCYDIINRILSGKNAALVQADGAWNVIRIPEYQLFTDAEIPGTESVYNGSGTDFTAVTLEPFVTIGHNAGDCQPVAEDQLKTLQRAIRLNKTTFDYNQPVAIRQNDLQVPADAVPYYTDTAGDVRTDRYDIPTYFPTWRQRGGVTSYLEVKTDVSTDIEKETDRYIVIIGDDGLTGGIQFNPIPISAGDKLHFKLQWRTDTDTDDLVRFWVRFIFITASATNYTLHDEAGTGNDKFRWVGPNPATLWDTDDGGIRHEISNPDDQDTTEWMEWDLERSQFSEEDVPALPAEDGMLLIEVRGTDAGSGTDRQNVYFKDIMFEAEQLVSKSIQIVGQTHTSTISLSEAKKIEEEDVFIDDSPSNTIAGTLFTSALTSFEYTDSTTGQETDIGSIYFTRTSAWHRGELSEVKRLGNIITEERISLKQTTRLIVDGTFRNVRYDTDKFISPLCLFTFSFYPDRFFVASSISIDYMECTFKARLIEIYDTQDIIDATVFLSGAKNTETSIFNGMIEYDDIDYYNGADGYLEATVSNSKFTYISDFVTTLEISVILDIPISGTGTATFELLKNGVMIASDTVDASEFFKRISFLVTEPVVENDYFEVSVDTGGADVDIQQGSINITVNDAIYTAQFPYSFKYKYDVKR